MRIRQFIPLAFLVGCSGKDPGEEGGDPFATKTTEDLRWKTFYQENMDEDGVYAVRQFSYTYGGDAHRYYTEAVGSVTADAEEKVWVHTRIGSLLQEGRCVSRHRDSCNPQPAAPDPKDRQLV
jgi:hypothetical protein